ncbi:MAG: polysaccharide biosynthesis tyrosine autokinase [Vicinamibacteria bacterium]|nr:polysaccharide biosynthesis tyrosine autokinase [Vicinamibacteria bacterium]
MTPIPPVTNAESRVAGDREIDVRYYAELLWRGRVFIVSVTLVALMLGVVVSFLQTPEFRATAILQIDPPTQTFMTVTDALVGSNYWQHADFYNTQFRVLRSGTLGDRVVESLKLQDRPPFKDAVDPGGLFMRSVSVDPIAETRLVNVSVTRENPEEAALWANTLAETYVKQSVQQRVDSALRASQWIQERLTATSKSLHQAEEQFFKALEGQDLFVPEGSVSAVIATITKLNEDFVDVQARRITIEAALKQVSDMEERGVALDALPQVAQDAQISALDAQLTGLNVELSRLAEKYKPAHPEIQRVQAQIKELRKARQSRARQIVDSMTAEMGQLQKRARELRAAIDRQKEVAAKQSRRATELETLKKEADSAKNLYDVLLQKLHETDIAASIRNNNVTVHQRAFAPSSPIRPNRKRMAGIALFLGLLLGVGLVLGREYLDNTIRDPEEIERYLHLDLLAVIPADTEVNVSLVTEAVQSLRTSLLFARSHKENAGQVVLVTSTAPQEGKTTTLVRLSQTLAVTGEKTLVLDFDLRRAQIHTRFDLTREPGLTNHFMRQSELEGLIRPTRTPNLFVVTAGPLPPNPPALLGRRDLTDLLERLRQSFEWILIDSPPLASVTDALLLARQADHVVFVVQHNKVDKRLIKRHVGALHRTTPNVLGAVLNNIDLKLKSYYAYYHYPGKGGGRGIVSNESAE